MSTEAQMDVERYGFNPGDMPDCFIPDNFHEVFQRIGIHGTKPRWNKRTGELETPHHVEGGVTAEDYIQIAAAVITAPDAIVAHDQDGGETRFYTKEIDGQSWVAVIPEHIIPGRRDPTMFPLLEESPQSYFKKKMSSRWMENPRVLFDCCVDLKIPKRVLDARREANAQKLSVTPHTNDAKKTNEVRAPHPANSTSAPAPAAQPVVATVIDDQSTSAPITSQNSTEATPSIDSQKSVPAEHEVNSTSLEAASVGDTTSSNISTDNSLTSTKESISSGSNRQIRNESSTQRDMLSTPLEGETTAADLQSGAHIDTSVDHGSISASSQPVAESVTSHDVETAGVDTADVDAVEATNVSLSSSELTSGETGSVFDATFDSSEVESIEAVEMDTPSADELSDAGDDSLEAADQPGAVDVSPAEQAESVGDAVDADGVSDLETAALSAEEDDSPSALDVVAYEAVESGEIGLDSVPSEDDVGAENVASEEDNGELGPDFFSGDESDMADQAVSAESVDGAQDALADAEMDDGDDVGVESEVGVDGELGAESDASDVPSSDLSLESSEESAEVDDGSLDVDEQATVEDVAALEDAASIEDEGDIDLDAALSVEPAMEDQSGAVDNDDDELDFVSEAEVAELEASLSDSDAEVDDATDLQGELLAADETDVYDVDESPLAGTDAPVDEDILSHGTAGAGDELEFVSEAEIAGLETSLSDSDAALDDDFLSPDEHDDMAVHDSPSAFDDTTDLQGDFLSPDDTSSVDDDFLSMDDLAVVEEDLPDSAVDAGDELGFDEPSDIGLDADNDGLDIDTDATDIDTDDDIDADDDDDVSESGGFSL
jgi:hypothetical protein